MTHKETFDLSISAMGEVIGETVLTVLYEKGTIIGGRIGGAMLSADQVAGIVKAFTTAAPTEDRAA